MKAWLCLVPASFCLLAQESSISTRSAVDLNGARVTETQVAESRSSSGFARTERLQSINGTLTPLERIEERVIRDDSSGKVVERITRRYDQTGNPGPPEKVITEETKTANGATVRSSTYRGDLNGNLQLAERSVTEIRKSGDSQTSDSVAERRTLNGFETVEKTSTTQSGPAQNYEQSGVTYRKGQDGFYLAVRTVTTHSESGGVASDNTAEYEVGSSGTLELHSQNVVRTVKNTDGSESQERDLYGGAVAGTVNAPGAPLTMKSRELVDRRPGENGSSVERVSVQRPSITDPKVLGPAKFLYEVVCRGKCQ